MRKTKVILFAALAYASYVSAQQELPKIEGTKADSTEVKKVEFKPSGKVIVTVFSNFHMSSSSIESINIKDGTIQVNDEKATKAFEITRAYFGYDYKFTEKVSSRIIFDVGNPMTGAELNMTAFLKNAYLQYQSEQWGIKFGMIATNGFDLIDKTWGHRYLEKTFQDLYKMGASADIGASAEYKPNKFMSFDMGMYNGEGFKSVQKDNTVKLSLGATLRPTEGLIVRAYFDLLNDSIDQQTYSIFSSYSKEGYTVGGEFDYQLGNKFKADHDYYGGSIFAHGNITKKMKGYLRYDNIHSIGAKDDPAGKWWNYASDGQYFIAGVQFIPLKGVKISPNYRGWAPRNSENDFVNSIFLNIEFTL